MRVAGLAARGAAAILTVHAIPLLSVVTPLRRSWLTGLSGLGAADTVALTFDDGPDPASTPAFLDALDGLGWKATFFMLGSMVRHAPSLAAEVAAAGHEIAVHGDQHRSHIWRSPRDVATDLERSTAAVADTTGCRPNWFRPPYGHLTTAGMVAARRSGVRPVLWTTWGRDWRATATPASVVTDVARHLGPGGTVLLHDSDCTSAPGAWRSALGSLPALADLFATAGLRPVPLGGHGLN